MIKEKNLFGELMDVLDEKKFATFSRCGEHRYILSRIWDDKLPTVMFIGLNPSKADGEVDDPTIKSVRRIAKQLGYGGIYMANCFPYITAYPSKLLVDDLSSQINNEFLAEYGSIAATVIFAWGNFEVVKKMTRDKELIAMFPDALALHINKDGSPKHPLYCKSDIKPVKFKP